MRKIAVLSLLVGLILAAACSEAEEAPIPAASPSPTLANPEAGVVAPLPPPLRQPVTIPANWLTFTDPAIPGLTFRYPAGWRVTEIGTLFSFDPSRPTSPHAFPPSGIKLQVDRVPLDSPALSPRPEEATDLVLSGLPAWEIVRVFDPVTGGAQRSHLVVVDTAEYRYVITAHFAEQYADETLFQQILSTLRIS